MSESTSAPTPYYANDNETMDLFNSFIESNLGSMKKMSASIAISCRSRLCPEDAQQELLMGAWHAASKEKAKEHGHRYIMTAIKNKARDIVESYSTQMFRNTNSMSVDFKDERGLRDSKNANSLKDQVSFQEGCLHNGAWVLCRRREGAAENAKEVIKVALAYADTIPDDKRGYGQTRRRIIKALLNPPKALLKASLEADKSGKVYTNAIGYEHSNQKVFCRFVGSTEKTVRLVIQDVKEHLQEQNVL